MYFVRLNRLPLFTQIPTDIYGDDEDPQVYQSSPWSLHIYANMDGKRLVCGAAFILSRTAWVHIWWAAIGPDSLP